jgi:high-affinity Fe2+/Pb2+ permease
MKRSTYLLMAGIIALSIGLFALLAPATLLASKGVISAAANVWIQEVGAMLIAVGMLAVMVRNHDDSPTMKAILISNVVIQIGLFTIEALAYRDGIITLLSGIIPNLTLHVCLASGLIFYIVKMQNSNISNLRK